MVRQFDKNDKEESCIMCGSVQRLHRHHIFHGSSNRKQSEKHGYVCWLCFRHHNGEEGVHFNRAADLELMRSAQAYFEEHEGTREEFRAIFGKSFL